MRRRRLFVMAALAAGSVLAGAAQQPGRAQIYATVIGDQGDPVRGLQSADLVLRDGGVRQGVLSAEPATDPLSVALVVNGLTPEDLADATRAIDQTVRAMLAQNSRTQVGLVADGAKVTLLTPQTPGLDALVRRASSDAPSFVEAAIDAAEALRGAPADRRVVLGIARPPSGSAATSPTGKAGLDRLATSLFGLHTALWTVEVGGPGSGAWSPSTEAVIADACRLGGTIREHAGTHADIVPAASRVTNLLLSQYLVTYAWPDPMLGQFNLVTRHEAGRVLVPAWSR